MKIINKSRKIIGINGEPLLPWSGFRVTGGNGNPSGNFLLSAERNCG